MAPKHSVWRESWQAEAAERGGRAERAFEAIMRNFPIDMPISGAENPREPLGICGDKNVGHGIAPDYVLRHTETDRAVSVELKRQRAK